MNTKIENPELKTYIPKPLDSFHEYHEFVEVVTELLFDQSSHGVDKVHNLLLHWLVFLINYLGEVLNQTLENLL
jgi:hypothetical protein